MASGAFNQDLEYGLLSNQERYERKSQGGVLTYGRNFRLFQSVKHELQPFAVRGLLAGHHPGAPARPDRSAGRASPSRETSSRRAWSSTTLSPRPAYVFDSRDNPFETTRGQRITAVVEYAGGFLGGDSYFYRPELTFSMWQPMTTYPVKTASP